MAAVHKGDEDGSENECLIGTIVSLNDTFYHLNDVFDKKELFPAPSNNRHIVPTSAASAGRDDSQACLPIRGSVLWSKSLN